ncbi:MAG: Methylamine utilization protein mauG [Myxococcaceae bacterium]|nr:Methylamine utilization protein mauG [Myxococcaceae bacterium]
MRRAASALLLAIGLAGCPAPSELADAGTDAHLHDHDHGEPVSPDAGTPDVPAVDGAYAWRLPTGFPRPVVPADNPMSAVKVELGRHLFYDPRLSDNGTQSCASCHPQARAFAEERATSVGSTGQSHPRNAMGLANVAYNTTLTWANPLLLTLEQQTLVPMFGRGPVELGLAGREPQLFARLRAEARYAALFPRAFPGEADAFTVANVARAVASFERTLLSGGSAYDRQVYGGDTTALSEAARRGAELFNSERLECFHCHNGFNFTDSTRYEGQGSLEARFHNTALYNLGGTGAYPAPNTGLHAISGRAEDMGRFRAPSLRNVALTAPYMHDGSVATLADAVDHYAAGGRTVASGPNAGVGRESPLRSGFITGFAITADERASLIAFLESLSDPGFVRDPALADPWPSPCEHCDD